MKKSGYTAVPMKCQWFLRCLQPATTTVKHPILGDVPCCAKCKALAKRTRDQRHIA